MKLKRLLWVLLYLIIIAIPTALYLFHTNSDDPLFLLSGVLGIIAYVLLASEFLFISRLKLIDRYFSLDRLYRLHMIIAVVAIVLAYLHVLLKGLYFGDSLQTSFGSASLGIFVGVGVFSILLMINRLFFRVKIIDSLRKYLKDTLKLKYQTKVLIHNLMEVALILLFVHILMAGSVRYNLPLEIVMVIYFVVPLGLYLNRKVIKVYFNKSNRYKVAEVIKNADNIVTLRLAPLKGKVFAYLPGQFLYLRLYGDDIPHDEHPFTISSSPSPNEHLSVTIKQLGDFTASLDKAKIGDEVYVEGAYGSFSYLKKPDAKKLCFIAGGIGITPFLSMLRYMAVEDKDREVLLLWGARNRSELIYQDELESYRDLLEDFDFIPVLSDDKSYEGEQGFIDSQKLKRYVEDINEYDFYLCGPPVMMKIELANLKELGVNKENIYFERFAI